MYSYQHSVIPSSRCSITGGEVYHGCAIPDLDGHYFFGDYCSAEVWSFRHDFVNGVTDFTDRTTDLEPAGALDLRNISSFGLDAAGEMYVCDHLGGEVFKIVPDIALSIATSIPANDSIDARRPLDPATAEPTGWDRLRIVFDPPPSCLTPLDIAVVQQGGVGPPPHASQVTIESDHSVSIRLSRVITPEAWTTIRHDAAGVGVRIGSLPADVNADRVSNEFDVAALLITLDGLGDPRPVWSTDLDRSALTAPADILEAVDLLNGAGMFDAYLGAMLP